MKAILGFVTAALLLSACNQYEKTPSGFAYKLERGGQKEKLKHGDFVKLHVEYILKAKDSVLNSSFGKIPVYFQIDSTRLGKHNFTEMLLDLGVGDKMTFSMSIDSLVRFGQLQYNEYFKRNDIISGRMEVLAKFTSQDDVTADFNKEGEQQKAKEVKQLEEYAKKNKLTTVKDSSGMLICIENAGQEPKAVAGTEATVRYIGRLENGSMFDANMGPDAVRNDPFSFIVGSGSVIKGWDEGLKYFGKGGKGKLLIPAMMGYGPQGSPPIIPPFSNLVFDIQIEDVKINPTPNPAPVMPGGQ